MSTDVTWAEASPSSGRSSATPTLHVAENIFPDPRTLTLTVASLSYRITQAAAACVYTLNPIALDARNEGGRLQIHVGTTAGCPWSVSTTTPWITVVTNSGTGTGEAYIDVAANPGDARQGVVVVAGQAVTVTQPKG